MKPIALMPAAKCIFAACLMLLQNPPQQRYRNHIAPILRPLANWIPLLRQTARRYGIPSSLVLSLALVESDGNPAATSSADAIGLLQVTPIAATQTNSPLGSVQANITAGIRYLRWAAHDTGTTLACLRRGPWANRACGWKTNCTLSVYNAGPMGGYQSGYVAAVRTIWPKIADALDQTS